MGLCLVKSSSDKVPSKMLDVIGYFVKQLVILDISSLAGGSGHYSQPYNAPFLPHEEELYNKLVHHLVSCFLKHIWRHLSRPVRFKMKHFLLLSDWLEKQLVWLGQDM